jgi:putative toxin-antitoxin system antitoxin component (TIGR02293 family)
MSEDVPDYLSQLLGGRASRSGRSWHDRIAEGLPVSAAESVKTRTRLNDAELAKLLGLGAATLRRARAAKAVLDAPTSDRLYRFSRIVAIALEVLESDSSAMGWLRRPQPALGGRVPLDLLVTQAGAEEVETLLRRIDHGVYP